MDGGDAQGGFDRELTAFHDRLASLRKDSGSERAQAAVLQLEAAADQLRHLHDRLQGRLEDQQQRQSAATRERQLLRAVVRDLPFALFLLDRDGRIRRSNSRAHALLGVSADYVSGKPFAVFLDVADRSPFRVAMGGVLRARENHALRATLMQQAGRVPVRLAMTAIALSGDPKPLVGVIAVPRVAEPGVSTDAEGLLAPGISPPPAPEPLTGPDSDAIRAAARGDDIVRGVTEILLGESDLKDAVVLQRTATRLVASFADWAIIDVLQDGVDGPAPARAVVATPSAEQDSLLAQALERATVTDAQLPCQVLESMSGLLLPHLVEPDLLGTDERGVAFLGAMGAHSLLCVPIQRDDEAIGALTLIRAGSSPSFRLAEQAAAEHVGDMVGQALHRSDRATVAPGLADQPEPFLPQRMLYADRLDIAWLHLPGRRNTAPFLDFYERPGGWGACIGSAVGGDPVTQAHVAMVRQWALLLGSEGRSPADVLRALDEGLRRLRPADAPVSGSVMAITPADERLELVIGSSGHRSSLCVRRDGRVQRTDGGGLALGSPEGHASHEATDTFAPGDALVFYTNELPEVTNRAGETFAGSGELAQCLSRVAGEPARRLIDALVTGLTTFAPEGPDAALVAVVLSCKPAT